VAASNEKIPAVLVINDLRFAAGFGLRYATPIGPVRLDFGFPFQPRSRDRSWQIFFDIGQAF